MLHTLKALPQNYYTAGIDIICRQYDADKYVAWGRNYRRNHHQSMVMFDAPWCSVIECYLGAHKGVLLGDKEVERTVIPRLRDKASQHKTRDTLVTLVDDRTKSIRKALPLLRQSTVFLDEGKDSIVSSSHIIATKAKVDRVLSTMKDCLQSWESMLVRTILRRPGKEPTKKRIELFKAKTRLPKQRQELRPMQSTRSGRICPC